MTKPSPIVVIDDDADDLQFFIDACKDAGVTHPIITFQRSIDAYEYLQEVEVRPFFVICDINMPDMNGLELREKINASNKVNTKAIPFLIWSTSGDKLLVNEAYMLNIQGYFKKPTKESDLIKMLEAISTYWSISKHPFVD